MRPRLKLLVIPYHYAEHQRGRAADLARCWGSRHEVYIIRPPAQPTGPSLLGKVGFHLRAMRTGYRRDGTVTWVILPALFRLSFLHWLWVRCAVRALFHKIQFDCVVNFSYWGDRAEPGSIGFEVPAGEFRYVYDLTDDHMAGYSLYGRRSDSAAIEEYVRRQMARASAVVVTSTGHRELVRLRYNRDDSMMIPNGYYEPSGSPQAPQIARDLRRQWGWEGRTVLGYVGSLDGWVNVEFLTHVFQEYRKSDPHACLLVVGGGPGLEFLRVVFGADPHVRITGWVPSTGVEPYFALLDVGLIPFDVNALTVDILPIKTLEYLCWGKPVVASPLNELKRLAFPNVFLTDMTSAQWAELIAGVRSGAKPLSPQAEVMKAIRGYSWERLADAYERLLHGNPAPVL